MQVFLRLFFIIVIFMNLVCPIFAQDNLELAFEECEPELIHDPPSNPITENLKTYINDGYLIWPLILVAIAGILTALSPCVYPLIPITLSIMGTRAYQSHIHGLLVSASYVLGMSLVYTILGATFAYLGILAGSLMQSPVFMLLIGLLFILLSLSMFNLINLVLPTSLLNKLSNIGGHGYRGAFLMGLVAGLIAAPCTGPVLGFILTLIADNQNILFGIILMFVFSLGLGLPFLILGTFSSMLSHLPKSGPWMNRVKIFFGTIMLGSGLYYLSFALQKNPPPPPSNSNWHVINHQNAEQVSFDNWLAEAKSLCKPVIVDFYADWCIACKKLDQITFADPILAEQLNKFYLIRIDSSESSPVLAKLQTTYGITGLPTIIFFDRQSRLNTQTKILGFISPADLLEILQQL